MKKYKRTARIKATIYRMVDERLFVLGNNNNSAIFIYNIRNNELVKTVGHNHGSGLYPLDNYIVNERYRGVDVRTLMEVDLFKDEKYYYAIHNDRYIIVRDFIGEFEMQYILFKKEGLVKRERLDIQGGIRLFENNGLIISSAGIDSLFAYLYDTELLFQWRFDLSIHYFNVKDNRIKSVKLYQDSLLVITDAGVLRLSASDGSVIWKTDGYVRTLEIVGNMGYVCTGGSLFKINLDTGEESGYGWECDGLPRFTYKGITFRASGHEVVYHDGLLWYSVYSSGHSFLIAINVDNGNYEWVHHVDTNEKTDSPQFYGDKMFLSDSGGFLHIYEKEL